MSLMTAISEIPEKWPQFCGMCCQASCNFWTIARTRFLIGTNTFVLPMVLLFISCSLVFHRHLTRGLEYLGLRDISALLFVQMLPIIALKLKLWQHPDRLTVLCRFANKVMIIHAIFLGLRVFSQVWLNLLGEGWAKVFSMMTIDFLNDLSSWCFAVSILRKHYAWEFSLQNFLHHGDLVILTAVACIAAVATEALDVEVEPGVYEKKGYFKFNLGISTIFAIANYLDVISFVPGVWLVYRMEPNMNVFKSLTGNEGVKAVHFSGKRGYSGASESSVANSDGTEKSSVQRQAGSFFAFLIQYFFTEDLISPVLMSADEPLVVMGHVAHFVLLIDFAGFIWGNDLAGKEAGDYSELQSSA